MHVQIFYEFLTWFVVAALRDACISQNIHDQFLELIKFDLVVLIKSALCLNDFREFLVSKFRNHRFKTLEKSIIRIQKLFLINGLLAYSITEQEHVEDVDLDAKI